MNIPRLIKYIILISILCVGFEGLGMDEAHTINSLTLKNCYKLALKHSEILAIEQEKILQAEAQFQQALSGLLPNVSFLITKKKQDSKAGGDGGVGGTFTRRDIPEKKITLSQPIFNGFKEFSAMAASKSQEEQRVYEKMRAEELLMQDVSEAFYTVLQYKDEIRILNTAKGLTQERINELTMRELIGRSRKSELVSAKLALSLLESELERAGNLKIIACQILEFLTGIKISDNLVDVTDVLPALGEKEVYLIRAYQRSDVKASSEALDVVGKQLVIAKADRLPSVSIEGSYYTQRVGFQSGIDWDAVLKVEFDIFRGGEISANVKDADSQYRQAQWQYLKTLRRAELDVNNAYEDLRTSYSQVELLTQAVLAAEEDYNLQVGEYSLNLVSNLDVLRSLQTLQEVKLKLNYAQFQRKRNLIKLKIATGDISGDIL